MRRLLVGIGNGLRRDDGVAEAVLAGVTGWERLPVPQLTPEVAAELAGFDEVVFVDAAVSGDGIQLVPVDNGVVQSTFGHHVCDPAAVVALARRLFNFHGAAFVCAIPGEDFGGGEGLSAKAAAGAQQSIALLSRRGCGSSLNHG